VLQGEFTTLDTENVNRYLRVSIRVDRNSSGYAGKVFGLGQCLSKVSTCIRLGAFESVEEHVCCVVSSGGACVRIGMVSLAILFNEPLHMRLVAANPKVVSEIDTFEDFAVVFQ
jgi:hypothetical protein